MIRRNPTRIELKLEDLSEYESIHKVEKKKSPAAAGNGPEVQKLLRQERIGCVPVLNNSISATTIGPATRQAHLRRVESLPLPSTTGSSSSAATPGTTGNFRTPTDVNRVAASTNSLLTSVGLVPTRPASLVSQTPTSFDEFGIGVMADSSAAVRSNTSSPLITTPTNNNEDEAAAAATSTPSSMELSYLNG